MVSTNTSEVSLQGKSNEMEQISIQPQQYQPEHPPGT